MVKRAIPLIPRWSEEAATLEACEQRTKLVVSSVEEEGRYLCGPRHLSTCKPRRRHIILTCPRQLHGFTVGSSWWVKTRIVSLSGSTKFTQECVRLFIASPTFVFRRRESSLKKSNTSTYEISKDFLEASVSLTSSNFASALATSGAQQARRVKALATVGTFLTLRFLPVWGDAAQHARTLVAALVWTRN